MGLSKNAPCPCGSGQKYKKCCYLYHKGRPCATPVDLMKSRYSAYAAGEAGYIVATTHPRYRPADTKAWRSEIAAFCKSRFLGLTILDSGWDEWEGFVEFAAKIDGYTLREKSRFVKEEGRWYYTEGDVDVYQ